jgi:hypothetical protein
MSLRKAIGGKGSWRQQVGNCTSISCPLYAVRPRPTVAPTEHEMVDSGSANEPKRMNCEALPNGGTH